VAVPGYNFPAAKPLSPTSASYAIGGTRWQWAGRTLDTWWVGTPGIAVGYFGSAAYWSMKVKGTVYRTSIPMVVGQARNAAGRHSAEDVPRVFLGAGCRKARQDAAASNGPAGPLAPPDSDRWKIGRLTVLAGGRTVRSPRAHFLLRFLPGLPAVELGRISLAGVEPRTPDEVATLHADWRALYLNGHPGLVTESFVQYGDQATPDEHFACEAFYSAAPGVSLDLSILRRYAARVFGLRGTEQARAAKAGRPQ
jgi:hypothetical protein